MGSQFVKVDGLEFEVKANGVLDISEFDIKSISEIKGLKSLANLQKLDLCNNRITKIKGLKSLDNLQELWLRNNRITEIKGLESLANLQILYLDDNQITEIKGLESLVNLQKLSIDKNQITEIKGLKSLANLQRLDLTNNQITEIKGLESLANLQVLWLTENQITEIQGLESLANLQELHLKGNQIPEDLINEFDSNAKKYVDYCRKEVEKEKMSSQFVDVYGTKINVDENGVLYLSELNIKSISDIKGLESLVNLQHLELSGNQITEIKGLESLANLQGLDLSGNKITKIKGLESLANLQGLDLIENRITEIKGLESLTNLQHLNLEDNQITEIKGLESLVNLQKLKLSGNQIPEDLVKELGNDAQKYVDYCRKEPERKEAKRLEAEEKKEVERLEAIWVPKLGKDLLAIKTLIKKKSFSEAQKRLKKVILIARENNLIGISDQAKDLINIATVAEDTPMILKILQLSVDKQTEADKAEIVRSLNFSIQEANKYLELLNSPIEYESNDVSELMPKAGEIFSKFAEPTLYDLLNNLDLDFYAAKKIGKYLIDEGLLKEIPDFPKAKVEVEAKKTPFKETRASGEFSPNAVEVLRGGDWKVEGSQSVFYYKVKVKNNSQFVITNVQVMLTSIPRGLTAQSDRYAISNLKPGSFESPTFKLNAQESCVGDTVEGIITYTDPIGKQLTMQISPFEICYVCNLLTPKLISKREFDQKVEFMEEKKLVIDSSLNLTDLESKIEQIVRNCNFALLQDVKESQDEGFTKIEAFAEGLYDKQDVALSVVIQKVGEGSKLVVKAMSDRSEKVTDLLRDFSVKLDDIKSDTELIKEYTSQIELILDSVDDTEAYLKDHLESDWEKIKDDYADYKEGIITRKQLIGIGIKTIGQRFVKKMIEKVSPI